MGVRVWGAVDDRLVEVRVCGSSGAGEGLQIEGLPSERCRTTADRVRAALLNSCVVREAPAVRIALDPALVRGSTSELDLPIALAALTAAGVVGDGLRSIFAVGRLGLDGAVHARGVAGRRTLGHVIGRLCQWRELQSEHMFDSNPH